MNFKNADNQKNILCTNKQINTYKFETVMKKIFIFVLLKISCTSPISFLYSFLEVVSVFITVIDEDQLRLLNHQKYCNEI